MFGEESEYHWPVLSMARESLVLPLMEAAIVGEGRVKRRKKVQVKIRTGSVSVLYEDSSS